MKIYDRAANVIDSAVGLFRPGSYLKRRFQREVIGKLDRGELYAAAKSNRMTGSWSPGNTDINSIVSGSAAIVRGRIRQLIRDFPYFARAIDVVVDYNVGPGILFQSRVKNPGDDKLDKKRIQQIEDAFSFWADEADISGQLHYYEMMQLAKRQDIESGEFLIIQRFTNQTKKRFLPYALQIVESEWLTTYGAKTNGSNNIDQGIEYNPKTGAVVAYHFADPVSYGKTIRVSADRVIHGFNTLRPGQLRGISAFVAGVLLADDLSEYMNAAIDTAKMASKYLAIVETADPIGWQAARSTTDSDTGQQIEELENAIIEYLRPGESIKFPTTQNPGEAFTPFVRLILTMLAVSTGIPYELLTGDYSGLNYSVARTVRNDFGQTLKRTQSRHIRQFCQKTIQPFFDVAVMANKLSLPNYFQNPWQWQKCEWQPPGMESLDPLKETKARIDEINYKLRSPYEIAKARGRDLEDIYREFAQAKELAEQYGITVEETSTALANSPSAILNSGKNGNGNNGNRSADLDSLVFSVDQLLEKLETAGY